MKNAFFALLVAAMAGCGPSYDDLLERRQNEVELLESLYIRRDMMEGFAGENIGTDDDPMMPIVPGMEEIDAQINALQKSIAETDAAIAEYLTD